MGVPLNPSAPEARQSGQVRGSKTTRDSGSVRRNFHNRGNGVQTITVLVSRVNDSDVRNSSHSAALTGVLHPRCLHRFPQPNSNSSISQSFFDALESSPS
jgi:hypothetical protein